MRVIDLVGKRFGRLEVISLCPERNKYGKTLWRCKCECGNTIIAIGSLLKRGNIKSCGCLYKETRHTVAKKHGAYGSRLYSLWNGIKARCFYPKHKEFNNYGGRGISICKEWLDFNVFREWAYTKGYRDDLTIERIDVNKDYCPENCTWISKAQQAWNKTSTVKVLYKDRLLTIQELAQETGVDKNLLRSRIRQQKWSVEKAVTEPLRLEKGKNC